MDHHESRPQFGCRTTNPQVQHRQLFLQVWAPDQDGARPFEVVDRATRGDAGNQLCVDAVGELGVDVTRADHRPQQLSKGVRLLVGAAGAPEAGNHIAATIGDDLAKAPCCGIERLRPGSLALFAILILHLRALRRRAELMCSKPKRPLSHSQPWLTASLSTPRNRSTSLRLACTDTLQPTEQWGQVLSTASRSHGRP